MALQVDILNVSRSEVNDVLTNRLDQLETKLNISVRIFSYVLHLLLSNCFLYTVTASKLPVATRIANVYIFYRRLLKVKFCHTCYQTLGPELIPVYRQSARRWFFKSFPGGRVPLLSARPASLPGILVISDADKLRATKTICSYCMSQYRLQTRIYTILMTAAAGEYYWEPESGEFWTTLKIFTVQCVFPVSR